MVTTLDENRKIVQRPKFFETLPKAREHAHAMVQIADRAEIFDLPGVKKPSKQGPGVS